jgi:hypothetical protein
MADSWVSPSRSPILADGDKHGNFERGLSLRDAVVYQAKCVRRLTLASLPSSGSPNPSHSLQCSHHLSQDSGLLHDHPQLSPGPRLSASKFSKKRRRHGQVHRRSTIGAIAGADWENEKRRESGSKLDKCMKSSAAESPLHGHPYKLRRLSVCSRMSLPMLTIDEHHELDLAFHSRVLQTNPDDCPHEDDPLPYRAKDPSSLELKAGTTVLVHDKKRRVTELQSSSTCVPGMTHQHGSPLPGERGILCKPPAMVSPMVAKCMLDSTLCTEMPTLSLFLSPVQPVRRCSNELMPHSGAEREDIF